jgi:hypothetical protein
MSFLTRRGEGPGFRYAGQPMHVLAGQDGQPEGFAANPYGTAARVLGVWAPAGPALAFMPDVGAALSPDTPPDPDQMRELYLRHASRLLP